MNFFLSRMNPHQSSRLKIKQYITQDAGVVVESSFRKAILYPLFKGQSLIPTNADNFLKNTLYKPK